MKTEIQKIVSLLNRTFEKGAWHGPSVKDVLQAVKPENVSNRLPNTHSIIELVAHMVSWRTFVIKRLEGDDTWQVPDELNFPLATEWLKVVEDLEDTQRKLLAAVERFPEDKLSDLVPQISYKYTFYTLIHGIMHHDIYHAGQIMLINKSTTKQSL